jgi:hypothetical protein
MQLVRWVVASALFLGACATIEAPPLAASADVRIVRATEGGGVDYADGFFDARVEIVRETPPGHAEYCPRMMALGERFDIEVLGPAPF